MTLAEAAQGAKIDVPTPWGTIALSIPPGTSSGKRLRVKGHGVRPKSGEAGRLVRGNTNRAARRTNGRGAEAIGRNLGPPSSEPPRGTAMVTGNLPIELAKPLLAVAGVGRAADRATRSASPRGRVDGDPRPGAHGHGAGGLRDDRRPLGAAARAARAGPHQAHDPHRKPAPPRRPPADPARGPKPAKPPSPNAAATKPWRAAEPPVGWRTCS